jgi:hypothetical protein
MGIVMVPDDRTIPRKPVELDRAVTRVRALDRRMSGCTMTGGDRADVKATAAKALEQARQAVAILEKLAR